MWLRRCLERQLELAPDDVALRDVRRALSWRQLHREVTALAAQLQQQVLPDGRVVVMSDNRVEVVATYFACAVAGVVVVPVNPTLADPEITHVLDRLEPSLAVAMETSRRRLAALRPDLPLLAIEELDALPDACTTFDDVALTRPFAILHTSATTGYPKGAVVDHRSLQLNGLSWIADIRPQRGTRYLNASPLFHGSVVIALHYLAAGAQVCILDRFTPHGCLRLLQDWRCQHMILVPSMIRLLLQARAVREVDLGSLELILHTAEAMPAELTEQAGQALGTPLLNVYGITEGGGPVIVRDHDDHVGEPRLPGATCVGRPLIGTDVRVVRRDGGRAQPDEEGEICLHGDGLMRGYWQQPEATAAVIRDGWLRTGDIGYRDGDGRVWVVNRRTDLILRGGQNVYPAEIERVLRSCPQVADVAVVAAPSEAWGETPWAFVEVQAGRDLDLQALIDRCVAELASYKRPSRFVAVDEIPRNPSGKLLRRQLRDEARRMIEEAGGVEV